MDRLGRCVLARPRLSLEQDVDVGGRRGFEEVKGRAHRDALAEELSEARAVRYLDDVAGVAVVKAHLPVAEAQDAPLAEARLLDEEPVDHRTVSASQVAHPRAVLSHHDLAVKARYGARLEDEIVGGVGAE